MDGWDGRDIRGRPLMDVDKRRQTRKDGTDVKGRGRTSGGVDGHDEREQDDEYGRRRTRRTRQICTGGTDMDGRTDGQDVHGRDVDGHGRMEQTG